MRDYTYKIYARLVDQLIKSGYAIITFEQYCQQPQKYEKWCILRHDVDRLPWNAVTMAEIEHAHGAAGSYYFRAAKEAYNPQVFRKIIELGHEGGYHYEDMDLTKGDVDKAYSSYQKNLAHFREFYPVATICMHGSPMSKYDNRAVWKKYDYKKDGILGEPYFDIDFNKVFYLTDTGRYWNNSEISVRDKVDSALKVDVGHLDQFIELLARNQAPKKIMINTHPHRWFDSYGPWLKELILQNIKNQVKKFIVKRQHS